ncbi:site-specific integrase [Sphingobacterium corticibacter]|uniref:Integrase n=1 Tax=Sphingobacterium corticibacter TaxID=2171749 RepID=A0A2T8HH10_9SPHI|nr:site-specific integrase [Sphingobacterium corticibacter]PVH24729.1 integrase [Sphingobacterium corticibacter]
MRSKSTFGIHFVVRSLKTEVDSKATVYVRIVVNGQRTEISLKSKVSIRDWDHVRGRAKGRREEIVSLNQHIERVRSLITDAYHQLVQEQSEVSIDTVKARFLGEEVEVFTIDKLIAYHSSTMSLRLAPGTIKNYTTTERYLREFILQYYGKKDYKLIDLSYRFIVDFETFLRNYKPKDHHQPLNNNGVMKHIERLRKLANLAVSLEWIPRDPFAQFKKHFERVERKSLSAYELQLLSDKTFSIKRLQQVLDMFLFSCYTGLSFIDLSGLSSSHIVQKDNRKKWIFINRTKTNEPVRIPLLPQALLLIEKYKDDVRALENNTVFPCISNQRMNGYLKEVAEICGIEKTLTFHIARHTFATTVTLSNGVPIESVSKMLGHTSIRTTQIYAKVIEQKIESDMEKLECSLT